MRFILLSFPLFLFSCQDFNSNSFDEELYSEVELSGSDQFKSAYYVLKSRCMGCHTHSQWAEYTSPDDWITRGLVSLNDKDSSILITRIWNYGGTGSNMPLGEGPLPPAEYTTLLNWVDPSP